METITQDDYRALASEHEEQATLIAWCAAHAYHCPDLAWVAAVPNGGKRDKRTAARMKREGVRAGYPDLLLDVACGPYHGWRCELKKVGGRVAKATQTPWHERLRAQGYRVDVCVGWEAAARALVVYLGGAPEEMGV